MISMAFRTELLTFSFAFLLLAVLPPVASANPPSISAPQALLVDYETGAVLYARDPERAAPPASMSKLMTAYVAFESIRSGRFTLDSEFLVSEEAWRKGGSKMFVEVGTKVRLGDLLRGVIVQSGNDACIVIAEGIAGTESAFASLMNDRARELGLLDSRFLNASGWPDNGHVMSPRDLVRLTRLLIDDFPEYMPLFAETEFSYGGINQPNRNPLLKLDIGADGMKTGYTKASGYGLIATAIQGDRRLILALNGIESSRTRSREAARLMQWGFSFFENVEVAAAGEEIATAAVWLGTSRTVPLGSYQPVVVTLPRHVEKKDTEFYLRYQEPLEAPIPEGIEVGTLVVNNPVVPTVEYPLRTLRRVERLGVPGRVLATLNFLIWGEP